MLRLWLAFFSLFLFVFNSVAANALVQAIGTAGALGSATSLAVTWAGNTTTGNAIVGYVSYGSATDAVSSIADSQTNTYTEVQTCSDAANTASVTTFYAQNITGGTTPTVTVTFGSSVPFRIMAVHEVSGADTTAALDAMACQLQTTPGTATDGVTSGTATVATGAYVFGAVSDTETNTAVHTVGTGFTEGTADGVVLKSASEYLIQGSGGSRAATYTIIVGTVNQITSMVSLKEAGGAPPAVTCNNGMLSLGVGC